MAPYKFWAIVIDKGTEWLLLTNAPALEQKCAARVLSLDGEWVDCSVTRFARSLSVEPGELVVSGMSGSPIISLDGRAFGLLSTGRVNPILIGDLPLRLLRGTLASMR
jgi:hypothetical protein